MRITEQDRMVVLRKVQNLQRKLFGKGFYVNVSSLRFKDEKVPTIHFSAFMDDKTAIREIFPLSEDYHIENTLKKIDNLEKRILKWTTTNTSRP